MKTLKPRLKYIIALLAVLAVEVIIAAFVHDSFIRPYFGDVLAAVALCLAVMCVFPNCGISMTIGVFLFCVCVEGMQSFDMATKLGIPQDSPLRLIGGNYFDLWDIVCYGAGCLAFALVLKLAANKKEKSK